MLAVAAGLACEAPSASAASYLTFPTPISEDPGVGDLVIADFDGDGALDFARAGSALAVHYGDGEGGFAIEDLTFPGVPLALAVADVSGDGNPDLIGSGFLSGGVLVFLNDGTGGFGTGQVVPGTSDTGSVATGDFDGDGNVDLVEATADGPRVLLGNGSGGFGAGTTYAIDGDPGALAVANFDLNGRDDVALVDGPADEVRVLLARSGPLSPLPGGGLDLFAAASGFPAGLAPAGLLVADFDGDDKLDIATAGPANASILPGDGAGGFDVRASLVGGAASGIASADFDADGRADLAAAGGNENGSSVGVSLGRATRNHFHVGSFDAGFEDGSDLRAAAGDFNGDGEPDVVVAGDEGANLLMGEPLGFSEPVTEFPEVRAGWAGAAYPLIVTNRDEVAHRVLEVGLAGDDGRHFEISVDRCSGLTLAPGATCQLDLRFAPESEVDALAVVFVDTGAPTAPHIALLAGVGRAAPPLGVAPTALSFAATPLGSSAAARSLVATNTGAFPLWVDAVRLAGARSNAYSLEFDGCTGALLFPDDSCEVQVAFRPLAAGTSAAALILEGDAGNAPVSVPLSGSTPKPPVALGFQPALLDFGELAIGSSRELPVTVENVGANSIQLRRAQGGGVDGGRFAGELVGCPRAGLAPGHRCRATIRFSPGRVGRLSGFIAFLDPRAREAGRLKVLGTGTLRPSDPRPGAQPRKPLTGRLKLAIRSWRRQGGARLSKRGLRLTGLKVAEAGRARLRLRARPRSGAGQVMLAQGARDFDEPGKADLPVKLTRRGRTLLARSKRLRVTAELRFRVRSGPTTTVTSSFVITP